MKRYATLTACVLMLVFLGTNQAWSVFTNPLREGYGFSAFQIQQRQAAGRRLRLSAPGLDNGSSGANLP